MWIKLRDFLRQESGAVTVDWVVLTAGICFFSVVIVGSIQQSVASKSDGIGAGVLAEGTAALEYGSGGSQ